jgi:hypothetical protein
MKIHSSSLTLSSPGSRQQVGKDSTAQNNAPSPSIDKDAQNQKITPPSTIEQIKKVLANSDETSSSNIIKPTDARTSRALSAYTQEFNAPQQAQRAQLITGINTYV